MDPDTIGNLLLGVVPALVLVVTSLLLVRWAEDKERGAHRD